MQGNKQLLLGELQQTSLQAPCICKLAAAGLQVQSGVTLMGSVQAHLEQSLAIGVAGCLLCLRLGLDDEILHTGG